MTWRGPQREKQVMAGTRRRGLLWPWLSLTGSFFALFSEHSGILTPCGVWGQTDCSWSGLALTTSRPPREVDVALRGDLESRREGLAQQLDFGFRLCFLSIPEGCREVKEAYGILRQHRCGVTLGAAPGSGYDLLTLVSPSVRPRGWRLDALAACKGKRFIPQEIQAC